MQFMLLRAQPYLWMLLFVTLLLAGCVGAPPIVTTQSACSSLLPDDWKNGVAGAPIPVGEVIGDWFAFADAQTGQLDKANDRYRAGVGIIGRCEARDREAIAKTRKRRLGIF